MIFACECTYVADRVKKTFPVVPSPKFNKVILGSTETKAAMLHSNLFGEPLANSSTSERRECPELSLCPTPALVVKLTIDRPEVGGWESIDSDVQRLTKAVVPDCRPEERASLIYNLFLFHRRCSLGDMFFPCPKSVDANHEHSKSYTPYAEVRGGKISILEARMYSIHLTYVHISLARHVNRFLYAQSCHYDNDMKCCGRIKSRIGD